jgi:hypothetical protein
MKSNMNRKLSAIISGGRKKRHHQTRMVAGLDKFLSLLVVFFVGTRRLNLKTSFEKSRATCMKTILLIYILFNIYI